MAVVAPGVAPDLAAAARSVGGDLARILPGVVVEVVADIDSTNSELMRRVRQGSAEPQLLVAAHQTAGRGRLGREWASAPGQGLTFSLSLPLAPREWSGLSLVVGLSLAQSLHPQIGLKWPNDLWWNDRKLGGILIETAALGEARHVVIGVGLNIASPVVSADLRTPPAGLRELIPDLNAGAALAGVVVPMAMAVRAFAHSGFGPWQQRFNERDVLRDRRLVLSDGRSGVGCGVVDTGEYRVQAGAEWLQVSSAELSLRPGVEGAAP